MGSNYLIEDESWFNWDVKENRRVSTKKKVKKPKNVKEKLTRQKTMVTIEREQISGNFLKAETISNQRFFIRMDFTQLLHGVN